MGQMYGVCSTPSGRGRWNIASGGEYGWQVRTTKNNPDRSFGTAWTRPDFSNSAGEFVNVTVMNDGTNPQYAQRANAEVTELNEQFETREDCPAATAPAWNSVHPICGGTQQPAQTYWWFRIQP